MKDVQAIEHQMMVAVTVVFIVFAVAIVLGLMIHMIGHGGGKE